MTPVASRSWCASAGFGMFISMLVVNRQQLLTKALDLENSVRGS